MIFHVSIFSLTDKYLFFFSFANTLSPTEVLFSRCKKKKISGALFAITTNPPKISNGLLLFKYKRRFSLPKKGKERERGVKSQVHQGLGSHTQDGTASSNQEDFSHLGTLGSCRGTLLPTSVSHGKRLHLLFQFQRYQPFNK